jgi:type I restriction enzyme, S subunit
LVIIQGLTSDIDRRYLRYVVASDATIQQAKLGVQSVGVPDLGMAKIRAFRIPLTCEAEQKEIVAEVERRLSVIEELEATIAANLTRADRLRQSILCRAFSGGGF